jgi:hypothetical protein
MSPTLAELRAQTGPQPLPRAYKVVTLVEGQHLLAKSQRLADELLDIAAQAARVDVDGARTGPPRKSGEGADLGPRADEIRAEQAELLNDLADFQAEVGLHGITGGEWQRFKDEHPPREDNAADIRLAGFVCNASDLFSTLGRFVASWNGEDIAADDWDKWLAERIIYADRRDLIADVVKMHEEGMARAPKLRTASPTTEGSATG